MPAVEGLLPRAGETGTASVGRGSGGDAALTVHRGCASVHQPSPTVESTLTVRSVRTFVHKIALFVQSFAFVQPVFGVDTWKKA
jgi:hypothetical protein